MTLDWPFILNVAVGVVLGGVVLFVLAAILGRLAEAWEE